jgi:hypothetical protein
MGLFISVSFILVCEIGLIIYALIKTHKKDK